MADVSVNLLSQYLGEVARRKFAFGELDCCTFMADWLVRCGLVDPMADRRGSYTTMRQYRRAIRGEGGLVMSCHDRFARVGLCETAHPVAGDVCLVAAPARFGRRIAAIATGAICVSDEMRAMVTADAGLVISRVRLLHAWGLPNA